MINRLQAGWCSLCWLLLLLIGSLQIGGLADAPFLVTVPIALLRKCLRAVSACERLHGVVRAHVILHIWHLPEHFQANFALSPLVLPASFLVEDHHGSPEFFLANGLDCLFFTKECWSEAGRFGAGACGARAIARGMRTLSWAHLALLKSGSQFESTDAAWVIFFFGRLGRSVVGNRAHCLRLLRAFCLLLHLYCSDLLCAQLINLD